MQRGYGKNVQNAVSLVEILQFTVQVLLVTQKQGAHHRRLFLRENAVEPCLQAAFELIQRLPHRPAFLPLGQNACLAQLSADSKRPIVDS